MSLLPGSTNPLSSSGGPPEQPLRRRSSPMPIRTHAHMKESNKAKSMHLPNPALNMLKSIGLGDSNKKDTPRTEKIKKLESTVSQLVERTQVLENNNMLLKGENEQLKGQLTALSGRVDEIVKEELTGFDPSKREIPDGMYS